MKIKLLKLLLLCFSPFLLFSQATRPDDWDEIIRQPWYYGTVNNKPAFLYLDETAPTTGYFFAATTALPEIYPVTIKWKQGNPLSISFLKQNKKIKAKFLGSVKKDTIAGTIKTSRKNANRLNIPSELSLFLVKEPPCFPTSMPSSLHASMPPSPHAPTPPCLPAPMPPRYLSPIFPNVSVLEEISYGAATGYYSSMPLDKERNDYQQIILEAMEKMYVNPTKEAFVHLLNRDPVSFALTDLQALRMDLYQPVGDNLGKRPLILLLHGGAFILGDKAMPTIEQLANDFASKGYVVASINYRMGFNPASKSSLERSAYRAVQDARAALRYLSANAALYRIDPDCVFLGGSSAGAITALNAAFMKEDERPASTERNIWRAQADLGGLDESTNTISGSFKVRAIVNLWGAVNDTSIIDIDERIPVLSIHGDADKIVPYGYGYPFAELDTTLTSNIVTKLYGSQYIDRRLKRLGIRSELITFPNTGHEPQYEPGKYDMVMDTIRSRATDFYFRALFNFPELSGPRQIAMGMSPPSYSIPLQEEITYYWQVSGGKIIPGSAKNSPQVVWLASKSGNISLVLVHQNGASAEVQLPVRLPE